MKYNKEVDELTIDNLLQESVIFFLDAKDKTPEVSSGEVLYRQGVMIIESLQSALQAHASHCVLCLGFLGKYSKPPDHGDRQQLLQQLTLLITSGLGYWRSPWLKVVLSFLLLMALSLGLQLHLHTLITTMDIAH